MKKQLIRVFIFSCLCCLSLSQNVRLLTLTGTPKVVSTKLDHLTQEQVSKIGKCYFALGRMEKFIKKEASKSLKNLNSNINSLITNKNNESIQEEIKKVHQGKMALERIQKLHDCEGVKIEDLHELSSLMLKDKRLMWGFGGKNFSTYRIGLEKDKSIVQSIDQKLNGAKIKSQTSMLGALLEYQAVVGKHNVGILDGAIFIRSECFNANDQRSIEMNKISQIASKIKNTQELTKDEHAQLNSNAAHGQALTTSLQKEKCILQDVIFSILTLDLVKTQTL